MRTFNYSAIRDQKWDSEILGLIAAIYKEAGQTGTLSETADRKNWRSWLRLRRFRVQRHPMQSKELSRQVHESDNWLRRRPLPRTEMSRRLQDIEMCFLSFMKALMRFR